MNKLLAILYGYVLIPSGDWECGYWKNDSVKISSLDMGYYFCGIQMGLCECLYHFLNILYISKLLSHFRFVNTL